jgi:hypothetical protein
VCLRFCKNAYRVFGGVEIFGVTAVQSSPGPDLCVSRDRASAWLTFPKMHFSADTVQVTLVTSISHDRGRVHGPLSNLPPCHKVIATHIKDIKHYNL